MVKEDFYTREVRSTKQIITAETIKKVRRIELDEFDDEENDLIQKLHKQLLKYSKDNNDSNEVGILIDLSTWDYFIIYGTENSISMKDNPHALEKMMHAPNNSLVLLHNHPRNTYFSEVDLTTFMTADSLYMISVIGNNGRIYFLIKKSSYNKEYALMYYEEIFESVEKSSVNEFLRTCKKVGLKFVYGGE